MPTILDGNIILILQVFLAGGFVFLTIKGWFDKKKNGTSSASFLFPEDMKTKINEMHRWLKEDRFIKQLATELKDKDKESDA